MPGLALFAIVPGILLLAYAVWLALVLAKGETPGGIVRRRGRRGRRGPELLGPGGPDDPDRTTA